LRRHDLPFNGQLLRACLFELGAGFEASRRSPFVCLHRELRDLMRFVQQIDELISRLNAVVKLGDIRRDFDFDSGRLGEPRIAHAERRGDLRALLAPDVHVQTRAKPDDTFRVPRPRQPRSRFVPCERAEKAVR
jgi:hypothetical protein